MKPSDLSKYLLFLFPVCDHLFETLKMVLLHFLHSNGSYCCCTFRHDWGREQVHCSRNIRFRKSIKSYALPNQEAVTVSEVLVRELVSLFRDSSRAALLSGKKFRIAFVLHYPFSFIPLSIIILCSHLSCSFFIPPPAPEATLSLPPLHRPRPPHLGRRQDQRLPDKNSRQISMSTY